MVAAHAQRQHYGVTLVLLTVAGISFALMQTLVVPALPFFQREFDTTASWVTWIATGFLLSSSVLTPILGKLGDAYGKKRMLVISLAIFGLASLGAAAAPTPCTTRQKISEGRLQAAAAPSEATPKMPRQMTSMRFLP